MCIGLFFDDHNTTITVARCVYYGIYVYHVHVNRGNNITITLYLIDARFLCGAFDFGRL